MDQQVQFSDALNTWAPNLGEIFTALAYLGSKSAVNWLADSSLSPELHSLANADGHVVAAKMWEKVLRERAVLPAPGLLLMLEHMRRNPARMEAALAQFKLSFSRTLANIAFRAADQLYEDAKGSFAGHEIDVAIARYRIAISEFRFSIESQLLSDATRKIATGKYATAVAMIGRWVSISTDVVSRALNYSSESMELGNMKPETLIYRLELLVLKFDQTGEEKLLWEVLQLLSENENISIGTELVEAEARYRFALLPHSGPHAIRRNLEVASQKLVRPSLKGGVEEARRSVLLILITEAKHVRAVLSSTSVAVPKGLLIAMATRPSDELWRVIRCAIAELEQLRVVHSSVSAAALSARFLRVMVDGPAELLKPIDLSRYVEVTQWLSRVAAYNRHAIWEAGAAALSVAKRRQDHDLALRAEGIFIALADMHANWPLPWIGIARVRDYISAAPDKAESSSDEGWRKAAELALGSSSYARSKLGGRTEVFAVSDARGFLSETFVFKRTTKANAEHEASMLNALRREIVDQGCESTFSVPRSLAIVEVRSDDDSRWVHVSQRAAGRLVSELSVEDASSFLEPIVDLLAVFHKIAGEAPVGKSAWRPLKDHLKMWSKSLFEPEQAGHFVDSLHNRFPGELPLVRKRDGHASNWIIDPAGRVVAIDLESSEFIPIGYDVAQLIEDNALIPATMEGWYRRLAVLRRYFSKMGVTLDDSGLTTAYTWFAITRALRLGTEREAGKHLRRHARELCALLTEIGGHANLDMARELLQALSRIEHTDIPESAPDHDHRRLSKAMVYYLRHNGPSMGVPIDSAGFAFMDDLALALGVDSSHLLAVAEHPGEPRFEVQGERIRALYGHSLVVKIDAGVKVGAPTSLYHGSSWSALDSIAKEGVRPMARRKVHLTNVAEEAMAVGIRKGAPVVFEIAQSNDEEPVAEGIWVAESVLPSRLCIINPFYDETGMAR